MANLDQRSTGSVTKHSQQGSVPTLERRLEASCTHYPSEIALPLVERPGFLRSLFGSQTASESSPVPTTCTDDAAYEAMREHCSDPRWLQHRGPAYSVLPMHSDLIKPPFQQVHAIPDREFIASNFTPDDSTEELYYVNGMRFGPAAIKQHLSSLVKTFGKPVTAIINDQETDFNAPHKPGFLTSLWHSACGFLSSTAGHAVERDAVERVEQAMKEHLKSGKPLHLIAHSQGSIIVGNALERVLGPESSLTMEEQEKVKALVRVSTFGAAEHYFPAGARVQEYAHHGDRVTRITSVLADIREIARGIMRPCVNVVRSALHSAASLLGIESSSSTVLLERKEAPVVFLDGDHDFGPFLEKIPEFFIRKHGGDRPGGGALVAEALTHFIATARFSDVMHELIIREMIQREDQGFARAFLEANPTGVVGSFRCPFMRELRGLAAN
jgi:hypothetical protein